MRYFAILTLTAGGTMHTASTVGTTGGLSASEITGRLAGELAEQHGIPGR